MISNAALCPAAPLLSEELTGLDPVVPELRQACSQAVRQMLHMAPAGVVVVGCAGETQRWSTNSDWGTDPFKGAGRTSDAPLLPFSLGLGRMLLQNAKYDGPMILQAIAERESVGNCIEIGLELEALAQETALLVLADGSACRTEKAPGSFDHRAEPFDAAIERSIRGGNLSDLLAMDETEASDLLASGRSALQVLAGATGDRRCVTDILYTDAPFGVAYTVAWLRFSPQST